MILAMKNRILGIFVCVFTFFSCSKDSNSEEKELVPEVKAELVSYKYELHTFVWDYKVKFTNVSKVDAVGYAAVYHRDVKGDFTFRIVQADQMGIPPHCPIILAGEDCIYESHDSGAYDPNLIEPDYEVEFAYGEYVFED